MFWVKSKAVMTGAATLISTQKILLAVEPMPNAIPAAFFNIQLPRKCP